MSGPICPTCSGGPIEHEGMRSRCHTCGWEGEALPNRALPPEDWARLAEKHEQWKRGVRSVLLVTLDPAALEGLNRALQGFQVIGTKGDPPQVTVELGETEHRPVMSRLMDVEGVTRVETL